jgi:cell wall-associated NlpC family hydrolase
MRKWPALAIVGLVCGLEVCISQAQEVDRGSAQGHSQAAASSGQAPSGRIEHALSRTAMDEASQSGRGRKTERALSSKDRQVVIAVAMRSKTPRHGERDCSHLVHAIYQRAGFPYAYATSDDLYDGAHGFQRVSRPKAGDLVVWRGHVGIVIRPSRHAFFSFLHAGPGIDDYRNRYWKGRGEARFYRYLKNAGCAGCTLARGRGE